MIPVGCDCCCCPTMHATGDCPGHQPLYTGYWDWQARAVVSRRPVAGTVFVRDVLSCGHEREGLARAGRHPRLCMRCPMVWVPGRARPGAA